MTGTWPLGAGENAGYRVLAWLLGTGLILVALWASFQGWGLRWDFANFYDAGHRALVGQAGDLYEATRPIAGQPPLGVMRFWGAPLVAGLYAPLALFEPETALLLFKLQNVAMLVIGLALLVRWHLVVRDGVARRVDPRDLVGFLVLVAVFQPFWTVFVVGGQTMPTVFLLLVLFLVAYPRGHDAVAALLLSLVFLIKPAFVVMLVLLAVTRCVRLIGWLSLWLAVEGALSIALFGWRPNLAFLAQAVEGLGSSRLWQFNSSVGTLVLNFKLLWPNRAVPEPWAGALASGAVLLRVALGALVVAIGVRMRAVLRDEAGRRTYVVLLALLFFLFVSEILWEHYLAVLFIPIVHVLARRDRLPPEAIAWVLAAALLCAGQNVLLAMTIDRWLAVDSWLEVVGVGLYKTGPLLVMAVFLTRHHAALARAT